MCIGLQLKRNRFSFCALKAKIESKIKPDCITNDIGWKPVTFVYIHTGIIHFRELIYQYLILYYVVSNSREDHFMLEERLERFNISTPTSSLASL